MSDIILGNNFKLYYNTDIGNTSPQGIDNVLIDELAAFPILSLTSETTKFDTYTSDYVSTLLSDQSMEDLSIVVNYIATYPSHQFLDEAVLNQTEFQLVLVYYFDEEARQISYAIVNGYISASSLNGDKDSVVQKNYNFTHSQVIARSMVANARLPLYEGDFGVGSDGIDIDQYSPDFPTGNSFIKIPAVQSGNPASTDMMGVGWTDNGQVCEFAVTKSGALGIYAKNASTAWTRIYTVTQSDAAYVALTGNQSIAGNKTFSGAVAASSLSLTTALPIASGGTGAATAPTARSNLGLGTSAVQNIGTSGATVPLLSTANTWSGVQTFIGRTFITNLASTTAGTYNGTANVTQGVTGILPIANGGTGNATGVATNVTGTVAVANGGTGSTNGLDAARALSVMPIMTVFSDADVNTIVTAGVYSCTSISPNIPAVITGTMEVYVRQGGLSITQIYHCNATSTGFQNRHYIRTGTTSGSTTTWTSWNSLTLTTTNVAAGTDLNTILSSGRYYGSFINSPTGSANSASAILDVTNTGGDTLVVQSLTFTTANVTWTRRLITATWSDWVQVYASNAKPSIADLGVDTYVKSYGLGVNSTTSPNYVYYPATSTNISDTRFINALSTDDQATTQQPVAGQEFGGLNVQRGLRPAQFGVSGRGTAASFWFRGYTGASATQSDWIQAFPSTGGTLTGSLAGTSATFTGAVQQRENNITYRQLISRSDAFSPYTVYNRLDQVEGTPPTAITSIGDITGRLTTTGGDPYAGRLVGGLSFQRNVDDTGRVVLNARNLTGGITSSIVLDGGQSSVAITGTLQTAQISATGTVERIGSGTLSFNANRTNGAVNSFYGAQTTAGQIFFGTASGNNFVVNNTQSNTGAWLTIDSSTAAFTTAVTVPSLTITNNLPITSGGTGAATAAAARTNLGLAYGTAAGTVAQGNDTRLNTVDGKTGGTITSAVTISTIGSVARDWHTLAGGGLGVKGWNTTSNNYIEMNTTNNDSSPSNYVNQIAGGWYTGQWSLGGVRGGSTNLQNVQLNVTETAGGNSAGFSWFPNGRFQSQANIGLGGRVVTFTNATATYLELIVDGNAKGMNFFDSDETLKENIENADGHKALDIIENIRPVSYKFKDYQYTTTEKDDEGKDIETDHIQKGSVHQYGVIAQEFEQLLPEGVVTHTDGKKALDPLEVLGLLLTTCHEQQKIIKQLQTDVEAFKNK